MDLATTLAFSVLFALLKDKTASRKVRSAMLKAFRSIWSIFSSDVEFRKVVFGDTTEP